MLTLLNQEFLLRVKKKSGEEYYIGRRYGDFNRLSKALRLELPGKVFPPVPKKNKSSSMTSGLFGSKDDSDADSVSSASTQRTVGLNGNGETASKGLSIKDAFSHKRTGSAASSLRASPRPSMDDRPRSPSRSPFSPLSPRKEENMVLYRESQRISLRAFLRSLLQNPQIVQTKAMQDFLTRDPVQLKDDDYVDIMRRKAVDEKRMEEQKEFYEIARKRAADLDIYMEQYVPDVFVLRSTSHRTS